MADRVGDYSRLEQLLHRLAFSGTLVQRAAADVEDTLFARDAATGNAEQPIFITSLPRAGTTILLSVLARLPGIASHTYRDMPFIMAPLLWSKLSRNFYKDSGTKERAHGDGIEIGYDSPEAFEEVLWRAFWPDKYSESGIELWTAADRDDEATEFFRRHMKKIVALRCAGDPAAVARGRYVSKNNANIARFELIPRMFRDCTIVVPIRSPMEHAASLLRQHLNFTELHRKDAFTKRYMNDIGHLEFGALHRPIRFPNLAERLEELEPNALDYWLGYWIAAFDYVKVHIETLVLVAHETARNDPAGTVERLTQKLALDALPADKAAAAALLEPEPPRRPDYPAHRASLRDEAEALYRDLLSSA